MADQNLGFRWRIARFVAYEDLSLSISNIDKFRELPRDFHRGVCPNVKILRRRLVDDEAMDDEENQTLSNSSQDDLRNSMKSREKLRLLGERVADVERILGFMAQIDTLNLTLLYPRSKEGDHRYKFSLFFISSFLFSLPVTITSLTFDNGGCSAHPYLGQGDRCFVSAHCLVEKASNLVFVTFAYEAAKSAQKSSLWFLPVSITDLSV